MFNQFSFGLYERVLGKKLPTLLGENSGISERTWRKYLRGETRLRPDTLKYKTEKTLKRKLENEIGRTSVDARRIIHQSPGWKNCGGLPLADLIYWSTPESSESCTRSIEIATQIDIFSQQLLDAAQDIESARRTTRESWVWLQSFFSDDDDAKHILRSYSLEYEIITAENLDLLRKYVDAITEDMMILIMSTWDLEFCSHYFSEQLEATPLFSFLMPRIDPNLTIDVKSGLVIRSGKPVQRKIFQTASLRLLDLLVVLIRWRKWKALPTDLFSVKKIALLLDRSESEVVSWRDESTRFNYHDFIEIWTRAMTADSSGLKPTPPTPLLVAAHLWNPLLTRNKDGTITLRDFSSDYHQWWEWNKKRLTANGLSFGDMLWPSCLR